MWLSVQTVWPKRPLYYTVQCQPVSFRKMNYITGEKMTARWIGQQLNKKARIETVLADSWHCSLKTVITKPTLCLIVLWPIICPGLIGIQSVKGIGSLSPLKRKLLQIKPHMWRSVQTVWPKRSYWYPVQSQLVLGHMRKHTLCLWRHPIQREAKEEWKNIKNSSVQ